MKISSKNEEFRITIESTNFPNLERFSGEEDQKVTHVFTKVLIEDLQVINENGLTNKGKEVPKGRQLTEKIFEEQRLIQGGKVSRKDSVFAQLEIGARFVDPNTVHPKYDAILELRIDPTSCVIANSIMIDNANSSLNKNPPDLEAAREYATEYWSTACTLEDFHETRPFSIKDAEILIPNAISKDNIRIIKTSGSFYEN